MKIKHNKGFSLVELIVVIAIMAILGGVGTVGYTKYIEQTNKKADMALVGNIMRAIETGTNSTMFVNDDSMFIGSTTFPVGFIVLDKDNGARVMTSTTNLTNVNNACNFETIENVTLIDKRNETAICNFNYRSFGCTHTGAVTLYNILPNQNVTYCTTHSTQGLSTVTLTENTKYNTRLKDTTISNHDISLIPLNVSHKSWNYDTTTLNSGTLILDGSSYNIYEKKNESQCEYAYAYQYGTYDEINTVGITTEHPLHNSISAAFGNISDLKLKYDGWGNASDGETHTYATFFSSAPTLMKDVSTLATTLILNKDLAGDYLSGDYDTAQDMVEAFAAAATTGVMTQDKWMEHWNNVKNWNEPNYHFGMGGKDFIYAARKAYNTSFASYCKTNGVDEKYANVIKDYKHTALVVLPIPDVVNNAAFSTKADVFTYSDGSTTESLYKQFKSVGGNYDAAFDKCKALYETYQNSDACTENGIGVYTTLKTINETKDIAKDANNVESGDFFKYYNRYLNEYDNIFKEARNMAESSIIIMVTVKNDIVTCDVSPSTANPRNK